MFPLLSRHGAIVQAFLPQVPIEGFSEFVDLLGFLDSEERFGHLRKEWVIVSSSSWGHRVSIF